MRISPSSYHTVPRTPRRRAAASPRPRAAVDHEITPECLIGCLKAVIPGRAFRALASALTARWPSRVLTVADVLVLYRTGQLAALPGLGRRRYAAIHNGLNSAGLMSSRDQAPGRSDSP